MMGWIEFETKDAGFTISAEFHVHGPRDDLQVDQVKNIVVERTGHWEEISPERAEKVLDMDRICRLAAERYEQNL